MAAIETTAIARVGALPVRLPPGSNQARGVARPIHRVFVSGCSQIISCLNLAANIIPVLRKTAFLSHLYIKTIILPRQARDKHRFCRTTAGKKDRGFLPRGDSSADPVVQPVCRHLPHHARTLSFRAATIDIQSVWIHICIYRWLKYFGRASAACEQAEQQPR